MAWIAIGAMMLLLVRPVCELWHAGVALLAAQAAAESMPRHVDRATPAPGDDAQCCLEANSGFGAAFVKTLGSGAGFHPAPMTPPFVPTAALGAAIVVLVLRWPHRARRPCAPFHVRSARILC